MLTLNLETPSALFQHDGAKSCHIKRLVLFDLLGDLIALISGALPKT